MSKEIKDTDPIETEEKIEMETQVKTEKPSFKLNIKDEIKSIPDYRTNVKVKPKRHLSVFAKIMGAIIIIGLSVLLSLLIIFAARDVYGFKKPNREIQMEIEPKTGVVEIANKLKEYGVINSSFLFKVYYKLSKPEGSLNYGEYKLNSNMSYDLIIDELKKYAKAKEEVKVTLPEGLTIYEMSKKLEASGVCKSKDFIKTLNNDTFKLEFEKELGKNPLRYHKYEGYVFPETHNFFKNDNPFNVAKKMLEQFDVNVTKEMRDQMKKMGYTLEETMTVASIVQKEAGKTSEMRKVASVYFNRLNNKAVYPNLQACPTRDYANQLKLQMDIKDQKIIDAYNTYEDAGLPPGPICNPGIEAIKATIDPEKTDYYFFCSSDDGQFYYGKTLKEHERNIRRAGLN